jgi:hypothetical protein
MTPTSVPFGPDFSKYMIDMVLNAADEAAKEVARLLWSALLSFLAQHWLAAMGLLFLVFVFATLKAMMGRWGTLGSVLYNFIYFGILFIIGLIWGPEVFLNDFFKAACAVILYPICYLAVGIILDKTGVRSFS